MNRVVPQTWFLGDKFDSTLLSVLYIMILIHLYRILTLLILGIDGRERWLK